MANDNQTSIIISARDNTAAAFNSAKQGVTQLKDAYDKLRDTLIGGALVGGMLEMVKSSIDSGHEFEVLSQKVGISVQNLAGWTLAANMTGTSIDSVAKGVKGLSKFMVDNSVALNKMGIDAKDANGALIQSADLFQALPDGVDKTALAVKLFGKAGMDMIPLLNLGSAGLAEAQEKSKAYGERMAALAPLSGKFNEQLAEFSLQSKEVGLSIATYFLPGLTGMVKLLSDVKAGGDRAKTALEWMDEEIPLGFYLKWTMLSGQSRQKGYSGPKNAAGLPASEEEQFSAATDAYMAPEEVDKRAKAAKALKDAKDLLGKQGKDTESAYLASLSQQLRVASGDTSEYSKQLLAISQGPAKDFSQVTKDAALALAKKIDMLRAATKANEDHARVLEKVDHLEHQANKAVADFGFKQDQAIGDITTRTGELGKTPYEVSQMQAARRIEKEYEDAVKKVNEELGKIGDIEGISSKTYEAAMVRDKATKTTLDALAAEKAAQDALNASVDYGTNEALREYGETAQAVGKATGDALKHGLQMGEDALVSFVQHGKLDFKSLVDYAEAEFIRLTMVRPFVAAASNAVTSSGGISGLLSGAGNFIKSLLPSFDVGTNYVPNDMIAQIHKGEAIVPAAYNTPGGNSQSQPVNINFSVSAIDAASFRSTLAANRNVIVGVVREAFTRRAITSPI